MNFIELKFSYSNKIKEVLNSFLFLSIFIPSEAVIVSQSIERQKFKIEIETTNVRKEYIKTFNVDKTSEFSSVIIKYPIENDLQLYYCTSKSELETFAWKLLKDDEHQEENSYNSALVMIGNTDKYFHLKYELQESIGSNIEIEFVNQFNFNASNVSSKLSLTECNCSNPEFYTRTQWGCPWEDESENFIPEYSKLKHFVIHHQGGNASAPYDATVRAIWDYHVNFNGWSDIGYHWLIDPDGKIYKGRAWLNGNENVLGAHMCGCNSEKLGVCLLGDFTNTNPSTLQYQSLINLLAYKACEWNVVPIENSTTTDRTSGICQEQIVNHTLGHRDGCPTNYTSCPGETFYQIMPNIINDIQIAYENCINDLSSIDLNKETEINIFPNPFVEYFTVENLNSNSTLKIIDIYGRQINFESKVENNKSHIYLIASKGLYILSINRAGITSQSFLLQKI